MFKINESFALYDIMWHNGFQLKSFNWTSFSWIFSVGFNLFTSKVSAIFLQHALK